MTRDEAIKEAWREIFGLAQAFWLVSFDESGYSNQAEYDDIDKAMTDILAHPTEYTAWIE